LARPNAINAKIPAANKAIEEGSGTDAGEKDMADADGSKMALSVTMVVSAKSLNISG